MKEKISQLKDLYARSHALADELYSLQRTDPQMKRACQSAAVLADALAELREQAIRGRSEWVKEGITEWYKHIHWDMHPRVEIREEDVADPVYESVSYEGNDKWEVIMTTPTHGRERIVLYTDGESWGGIYSADRIG